MLIIPAIDIKGGKCVRLVQGLAEQETVYFDSPLEVAKVWEKEGADMIHVVDLDGAFVGELQNVDIICGIAQEISIPIEVGGGIRTMEQIDILFDTGVKRCIIGTAAITEPDFLKEAISKYNERIIVGVDAKDGMAAIKGWKEVSNYPAVELGKQLADLGVREIVYTDISRDGMLVGPNFNTIRKMAEETGLRIVASGGVSALTDIQRLLDLEDIGVSGIIIGKALYERRFTLKEAVRLVRGEENQ